MIVPTGSQPASPTLPGAVIVEAALADPSLVRGHVALVDEDGHVRGASAAEHLARLGHPLTLVTPLATAAADLPAMNFGPQLHRLAEASLAAELTARAPGLSVRLAGDCVTPRTALQAIAEGHAAGRAV